MSSQQLDSQVPLLLPQGRKVRFSQTQHVRLDLQRSQDKIYELPSTIAKRSTSFGFGKKSDFTNGSAKNLPAPGQYDGIDRMYKFKRTGLSFGIGRETAKFNDLFKQGETRNPPPGHYRPEIYRKQQPVSISLKNSGRDDVLKTNGVPGPGYYKLASIINGNGHQTDSRYRSYLPKVIMSSSLDKSIRDNGIFPL